MKYLVRKCKTILASTVIFITAGMLLLTSTNAAAVALPLARFGFLCGEPNSEPTIIPDGASYRTVAVSTTTTVLNKMVDGKNMLRHFAVVKSYRPNDTIAWRKTFSNQSLAIATVIPGASPYYFIAETLNIPDRPASPVLAFPGECMAINSAEVDGVKYTAFVLGTTAQSGGSVANVQADKSAGSVTQASGSDTEALVVGQDKTVINVWVLNATNGNTVKTFKLRPKPRRYLLAYSSGIYDLDGDGDDELVLVYGSFVSQDRYDFRYERYNLITGALEDVTVTQQNNKIVFQK